MLCKCLGQIPNFYEPTAGTLALGIAVKEEQICKGDVKEKAGWKMEVDSRDGWCDGAMGGGWQKAE